MFAAMTLDYADYRDQHTNHGADLMHGNTFRTEHISAQVLKLDLQNVVNFGWVVRSWAAIHFPVAAAEHQYLTADAVGADGALVD